jgi:hypothetical protein
VGASAQVSAGFALSAVGGIEAAAQGVLAAQVEAEIAASRGSFAVPASVRAGARVDSRALTYGRGVPLKPPATVR